MRKALIAAVGAFAIAGGVAVGSGAGTAGATTGYGNTPDTAGYLGALRRDGIAPSPDSVKVGMGICALLARGMSVYQVANTLSDAEVPFSFVFTVANDAHNYLCPDATPDTTSGQTA
jgi:hypothetical protein